MRHGSLLIDLAGIYWEMDEYNGKYHLVAEGVAKNFGVFTRHVYLMNLKEHLTAQFTIAGY